MGSFKRFVVQNNRLLLIAVLAFLLNQGFEFSILSAKGASYTDLCQWDCPWYARTVNYGYDFAPHGHERGDAANWAFFPALTIAARSLVALFDFSAPVALLITSKVFFLLAIISFLKLCELYAPRVSPALCAAVLSFNPYSLYGNVGYTESLFLFFTCLSFIALKRERFVGAGLAGAVLSAVRPTGVFVTLALMVSSAQRWSVVGDAERLRMILGGLLAPLGLGLFMMFLYFRMGDAMAFSHVQVAWERTPSNPFAHLLNGLIAATPLSMLWVLMSLGALAMAAYLAISKEYAMAAFSLCATLIPLATGLVAMPRYLWWQAPLLLVLVRLLSGAVAWAKQLFTTKNLSQHSRFEPPYWAVLLPLSLWGLHRTYTGWLLQETFII